MKLHNQAAIVIQSRPILTIVIVLMLTLEGCSITSQSSLPCTHWFQTNVTMAPFETLSPSNRRNWVSQYFKEGQIVKDWDRNVTWTYEGHHYGVIADNNPVRSYLVVDFVDQPNVDTVVRCIGEPDWWATLAVPTPEGTWWTQFTLWYVGKGIKLGGYIHAPDAKVNGSTLVEDLYAVKPRTVTQTVEMLSVPKVLESLKPWPIQ